jgi:hypothetical protein
MTEAEWLGCDEPEPMLRFLYSKADERRLRLFAVACCRRIWDLLTDQRSRRAVEVAEQYAERMATAGQLKAAHVEAFDAYFNAFVSRESAASAAHAAACDDTYQAASSAARHAATAAGDQAAEHKEQAALLRHLFGNPYRPVNLDPAWLAWSGGTVRKLARAIYEERRFQDLPVLADALEEAGCDSPDILAHCREVGAHVRGCWVLELLLAKG